MDHHPDHDYHPSFYPPKDKFNIHVIHPKHYVIDWMEEGMKYDEIVTTICGHREMYLQSWEYAEAIGTIVELLDKGLISDDVKCDICFRDEEALILHYLAKV